MILALHHWIPMIQPALILRNRIMPLYLPSQCCQHFMIQRILLIVVSGCLLCGCKPAASTQESNKTPSANALDRVTVGKALRKSLQLYTEQPARVHAFEDTPLVSKLAGYIQEVKVDIGDKVAKDQLLISLHAPEYVDQQAQKLGLVTQAKALVHQADAAVVAAEAAANSTKATIAEAEARIAKAEADFARWESENKRIQELASSGTVTNKLAEETLSQLRSAAASKDEAVAALAAANAKANEADANVLKAKSDVDVTKAKFEVAQAELAQAETMLQYMELKAPFAGVVTSRNVDVGHFVQPAGSPSSAPLMTIANVDRVRVFVNVPESEAGWVDAGFSDSNRGDSVRLTSPTLSTPIDARVTRTSLQLNAQSRTLSVEIDVDNQSHHLLPGAFVTAKILLEQRDNVLVLPVSAIVKLADKTICCAVVGGKIEHRPIELGLRVGDEVEIVHGITDSDSIALLRASSLQPGQAVEVIEKK